MSGAEQGMLDITVSIETPIFETTAHRAHWVNAPAGQNMVWLMVSTPTGWESWGIYSNLSECIEAIEDQ